MDDGIAHTYTLLRGPLLSYDILSYPILSCAVLSYPILCCPVLSYPILSILSYQIPQSYPGPRRLRSPVLSSPVLFPPILRRFDSSQTSGGSLKKGVRRGKASKASPGAHPEGSGGAGRRGGNSTEEDKERRGKERRGSSAGEGEKEEERGWGRFLKSNQMK